MHKSLFDLFANICVVIEKTYNVRENINNAVVTCMLDSSAICATTTPCIKKRPHLIFLNDSEINRFDFFWATVCKTVRHMLSDRCPVCDVGVLWPNSWLDQDETWHVGRPRP